MTTPAMIVLRSGDKVLVTFADEPDEETLLAVTEGLRKSFPGIEFTTITGVSGLAISSP